MREERAGEKRKKDERKTRKTRTIRKPTETRKQERKGVEGERDSNGKRKQGENQRTSVCDKNMNDPGIPCAETTALVGGMPAASSPPGACRSRTTAASHVWASCAAGSR